MKDFASSIGALCELPLEPASADWSGSSDQPALPVIFRTWVIALTVLLHAATTALAAAHADQTPQAENKDTRYYVHVSGIT